MKKWMIYVVLVVGVLTGCTAKKNMAAGDGAVQIEDVKWQLVELKGTKVDDAINGKIPYLELHSGENRYGASGGCNGIGGTYELSKGNDIKFSPGFSTKMACPVMDIESGLHDLFQSAQAVGLEAGGLVLKDNQGAVIARFKKIG